MSNITKLSTAKKKADNNALKAKAITPTQLQLEEPEIIPLDNELSPVMAFDYGMLPDAFRPWVEDIHKRMQCPPDYLGVSVMVSLATVIGNKVAVYPKAKDERWKVIPNLWGVLIGRPSMMKTPALSEIMKPIQTIEKEKREEAQEALRRYEVEQLALEARIKSAKAQLDKATRGKSETASDDFETAKIELEQLLEEQAQLTPPPNPRYIVNDSTIEMLGKLLNENPNGLTLVRDELMGWILSLDKQGREGDRAFYLEAFNGDGTFTYDRIQRGTLVIESVTLSVIGGIQPSKLEAYTHQALNNGAGDDGFIQRLQLAVYPDDLKEWKDNDEYPDYQAQQRAEQVIKTLAEIPPQRDENGNITGLHFTLEAQQIFREWREHLEKEVRRKSTPPAIESHLVKYRSLIPSIALLLQLADNPEAIAIEARYITKAVKWYEYLYSHAKRMYGGLKDANTHAPLTILDKREKLPNGFAIRDIHRKKWAGLTNPQEVRKALDKLEEHGYLIRQEEPTKGRPKITYYWNSKIEEE